MAHEAAPATPAKTPTPLVLPVLVFGSVEVNRLIRELESLEEFLDQSRLREPGKQPTMPKISRMFDAISTENKLNLLQPNDRVALKHFLQEVSTHAPSIHISFASDPSAAFTAKIVTWLRNNIHPHILLQVGLQPTIAAGCMVRTSSRVYDLSLRNRFDEQRHVLLDVLGGK